MPVSLIKKAKIVFKNSTKSIRRSIREVKSELFLILKSNKYSKRYPDIFAIFSIIEQEQNSRIYDLQKGSFNKIRNSIIKDPNESDNDILNAIRGLFHNNEIPSGASSSKVKIAKYIYGEAKNILAQKNEYDENLLRVLVFEFPFIIAKSNYSIVSGLIKRNSKGCNKILKEILFNVEHLGFLKDKKDIFVFINLAVTYNNKSAFMILVRFLRLTNCKDMIFEKSQSELLSRIFSSYVLTKKGSDFGLIAISLFQNRNLSSPNLRLINGFLKSMSNARCQESLKKRRVGSAIKYLNLCKSFGYKNSQVLKVVKFYCSKTRSKSTNAAKSSSDLISEIVLQQDVPSPSPNIAVGGIVNIAKQFPEEYWLMNNANYLV